MYSLGIILLQLLVPFETKMELADILKRIRNKRFPNGNVRKYKHLLESLLRLDPDERPDALELTKTTYRRKRDRTLQQRLNESRVENKQLKEELKEKDMEIDQLKTEMLFLKRKQQDKFLRGLGNNFREQ